MLLYRVQDGNGNKLTLYSSARDTVNVEPPDCGSADDSEFEHGFHAMFARMGPMALAALQNSNEIEIKVDLKGVPNSNHSTHSSSSQVVYELVASQQTANGHGSDTAPNTIKDTAPNTTSSRLKKKAERRGRGNVDVSSVEMGPFPSSSFGFMANIGRGAYGVVDKAFDLKSCRIVAVKRSRSPQQKMMDSLKKEVLICREFAECRQIVDMVSFGRDRRRNELCMALEYMDCGSLRNKASFTVPEVQWICVSVLKALRALHTK